MKTLSYKDSTSYTLYMETILTESMKHQLMKRFPKVKLSYDNILHKKVSAQYYVIIPKGTKAFMWLTYIGNKNVCIILSLNHKGNVREVNLYHMSFDKKLSHGTVLYGTIFRIDMQLYFTCENIHVLEGRSVINYTFIQKLNIFRDLFENSFSQKCYTTNSIIPFMPIICKNNHLAKNAIDTLLYPTYSIRAYTNTKYLGSFRVNNKQKLFANFIVRPDVACDIYKLYVLDNSDKEKFYGNAMIPSYKCSVMMNSIFRSIKENSNLDLLEESDSEEEFENIAEDKFVDLDKTVVMRCEYITKFKKWKPLVIVEENCITTKEAAIQKYNI